MKRKLNPLGPLGLVTLAALILTACGGGGGGDSAVSTAPGATAPAASSGIASTPGFTGFSNTAAPVALGNGTAIPNKNGEATDGANATWVSLAPQVAIDSITINSPPVIKFRVADSAGRPVVGLGSTKNTCQAGKTTCSVDAASGNQLPQLQNIQFSLARLVPGANGAPSKWVNLLVFRPPTLAERSGTVAATAACDVISTAASATNAPTWCAAFPGPDREGKLVDNNDGSYVYTFYRDPTKAAAILAAIKTSADGSANPADLGDVSWNPAATHRLGIEISGPAPGTSTNTTDGTNSSTHDTKAYYLASPVNLWYDFRPDGQAVTATRQIVSIDSCAECHNYRGIGHFPLAYQSNENNALVNANASANAKVILKPSTANNAPRKDPNYCVICHTDQTKFSFAEAAKTATGYSGKYARVNGESAFTYPRMIHQTHMGEDLVKDGYNLNSHCDKTTTPYKNPAQCFEQVKMPQDQRDCLKCHNGSTNIVNGTNHFTRDGDNWKKAPNRMACGACHDGIDFATGKGSTLADAKADDAAGNPRFTTQSGHGGKAQADDGNCSTCHHTADAIAVSHAVFTPTPHSVSVKSGISNFTWDIKSVTVNASNQPVITFRIQKIDNGAATTITSLPVAPVVTRADTANIGQVIAAPTFEPIPGFAGGPTLYAVFGMAQDGIANPADWNASVSVSLTNILVASGSPKAGSLGTPSGGAYQADANGYFTATLTGDASGQATTATCPKPAATLAGYCVNPSPITIPTTAKMVTGALIGSFTQKNVPGYPYFPADYTQATALSAVGGLNRPGPMSLKTADIPGNTPRRTAVDSDRCNNCHDKLGTSPAYHGQSEWAANPARNIPASPGYVKSASNQPLIRGTSPRNEAIGCSVCHSVARTDTAGWSADTSTWFHGIHGASKRTVPFTVTGASATDNFSKVIFPGLIRECGNCHVPNAVNFGTVKSVGGAASSDGTTANLLWSTAATGSKPADVVGKPSIQFQISPYAWGGARNLDGSTAATSYGSGFSFTATGAVVKQAATTTLVNSPIASACFACHDSNVPVADGHLKLIATTSLANVAAGSPMSHILTYGGVLYQTRSSAGGAALNNTETCLNCHGVGQAVDAATVHHR